MSMNLSAVSLAVCVPLIFGLSLGLQRSIGIYFIIFQDEFNASASQVSFVFGLATSIMYLGGPFYAAIYTIVGPCGSSYVMTFFLFIGYIGTALSNSIFTLAIFQGLFMGLGYGMSLAMTYTTIGESFTETRALVNNINTCAVQFMGIIAPLEQKCIHIYSWRGVMLLKAGVMLNIIPLANITSNLHQRVARKDIECAKEPISEVFKRAFTVVFDSSLLLDGVFMTFCLACVGLYSTQILTLQFFVRYAQSIDINDQIAANMMALFLLLVTTFGLITGGALTVQDNHHKYFKVFTVPRVLVFAEILEAFVYFIPLLWTTAEAYYIYAICLGTGVGLIGSFPLSLIPHWFGVERLSAALGYRSLVAGIFTLIIPTLAGWLVDITGSYRPVQYIGALMNFMGGTMIAVISFKISQRKSEKYQINVG